MRPGDGRRVVASHAIARRAFRLAGVFGVVALVWAVVVLVRGGSWWGPLHAFLAGAVLLAISGASLMFTITWAAASPPSALASTAQRWLMASGAAAALVGVTASLPALVWVGAAALATGLVLLGGAVIGAVRRSLLRRFDLSARFYLTAFACGVVGMTLGALLGTDSAGASFGAWRLVHSHLNLVGLVGLVIIGTIPTFLPTVAHHRAVSGKEAQLAWWLGATGVAAIAAGTILGPVPVGAGTLAVGTAGLVILAGILARLWDRGRDKLQFLQVSAGTIWLAGWAVVDGLSLISGGSFAPFAGTTGAVVVAGVGQVLLGSLAYLVPVLKGPPLAHNLALMTGHAWIPLAAANAAGLMMISGWNRVGVALLAIWVVDFARRLIAVLARRPAASD